MSTGGFGQAAWSPCTSCRRHSVFIWNWKRQVGCWGWWNCLARWYSLLASLFFGPQTQLANFAIFPTPLKNHESAFLPNQRRHWINEWMRLEFMKKEESEGEIETFDIGLPRLLCSFAVCSSDLITISQLCIFLVYSWNLCSFEVGHFQHASVDFKSVLRR